MPTIRLTKCANIFFQLRCPFTVALSAAQTNWKTGKRLRDRLCDVIGACCGGGVMGGTEA
jgi:hypothetical protein